MRQQMIVVLLTALFAGCGAFTLVPATATASATPTATSTFAPATATARALQQQINAVLFEATIVMATIYALSRSDAPRQQVGQDSDRLYRLARTRGREDARVVQHRWRLMSCTQGRWEWFRRRRRPTPGAPRPPARLQSQMGAPALRGSQCCPGTRNREWYNVPHCPGDGTPIKACFNLA